MHHFIGILGMLLMMGLAYIFSTNRRAIRYKTVAWGLGLQIGFAFLIMRWEYGRLFFEKMGAAANWLLNFAYYGSAFVFGDLGEKILLAAFILRFRLSLRSFSSPLFLRCSTTWE
jgi:CNT family concentrative nucleoside transporter